ncbi:diacylglycerol/lipid kinase family protein [Rubellimicrobium aerolatum]|uniref:Diacylglycerol/lipid kinase family protein n=1 Tax=Rubellimicrobium aerolatum TaxID=490979 RepID=A0ABW0SA22_9RHOB|nr:diacylglycerol kinase family protein [Rubellimicrobium aerolatum]MBP1805138.1 diacylglycerol kinase family enzyme [Rubellimicrobium aerolatum]
MTDQTPRRTDDRICVICNQGSGRNSREADAIRIAMEVLGPHAVLRRVNGHDIKATAQQAVRDGFGAVVAAGGDGTIMTVAGAMADSGRRFGVLPLGTFNYFARGLGIPEDPAGAARIILDGHTRPYAVGEVNGHVFLNNISLGIYPAILRAREDVYARWGRRRIAAHWSAAKTFVRFQRPLFLTVQADGEERRVRTPLLFVARSAYQLESFGLAGSDCVADGRFAVFVAPDTGRVGLFEKAFRLVRRSMREGRDFDLLCASEVGIATRSRHLTVACDGEKFRMRTPLRLRMRHDALEVFAPSEAVSGEVTEPTGAAA